MKTECIADYVKLKGKVYPCTVSLAMDLIGGKWKAVTLYHLKDIENITNELRKEMPRITEMTLSLQLKQLEKMAWYRDKSTEKSPQLRLFTVLQILGKHSYQS